jgi:hypothetical protein
VGDRDVVFDLLHHGVQGDAREFVPGDFVVEADVVVTVRNLGDRDVTVAEPFSVTLFYDEAVAPAVGDYPPPLKGDTQTGFLADTAFGLRGIITGVDRHKNQFQMDIGYSQGAMPGDRFVINHGFTTQHVGSAEIINVAPWTCSARVLHLDEGTSLGPRDTATMMSTQEVSQ